MDFIGTGLKLTAGDITRAAQRLGCDEATIKAVLAVEARASGWDPQNRPKILFEPHVFYRCLPEHLQAKARSLGLAWPSWRPGRYPETSNARYEQLERAMEIHETAALKACSWGIGQVLGENHISAGHHTPQAMVNACKEGEGQQLDCMLSFMVANGLRSALQRREWRVIARVYNGASYAQHGYHTRLEMAWKRAAAEQPTTYDPLSDGLLMKGDKGEVVRVLQIELQAEGFRLVADGDFGSITEQAVRAYQRRSNLKADGKVGRTTGRALGLTYWG